jgi:hypothetical protein
VNTLAGAQWAPASADLSKDAVGAPEGPWSPQCDGHGPDMSSMAAPVCGADRDVVVLVEIDPYEQNTPMDFPFRVS